MTWLDRLLQRWRITKASTELGGLDRVLDVGSHDGALFRATGLAGVGVDPLADPSWGTARVTLLKGSFPGVLRDASAASFDAAVALAVVEHVPEDELVLWGEELSRLVRPGGRLVLTVPSPMVDHILHGLMRLRLVAGMEAHQHHGFEPADVMRYFGPPAWELVRHRRFQLGLNNLFVFQRSS